MTPAQFQESLKTPYAWPGGFAYFFVMADGEPLCHPCALEHKEYILDSIADQSSDGWQPISIDVNYEQDDLFCDHCNKKLNPEYGPRG